MDSRERLPRPRVSDKKNPVRMETFDTRAQGVIIKRGWKRAEIRVVRALEDHPGLRLDPVSQTLITITFAKKYGRPKR